MCRESEDGAACCRRVAQAAEVGGKDRERLRALPDVLRQPLEHRAARGKLPVERQQEAALEHPFDTGGIGIQQPPVDRNRLGAHRGIAVGALLIQASEVLVRGGTP